MTAGLLRRVDDDAARTQANPRPVVRAFQRELGFRDDAVTDFYNHHEAHALAPLFYSPWNDAFLATTGIILSAGYALWLYRRLIFGKLEKPALKYITDLSWREVAVMAPLVVLTILFGFYPAPVLDASAASVEALIKNYETAIAAAEQARIALAP